MLTMFIFVIKSSRLKFPRLRLQVAQHCFLHTECIDTPPVAIRGMTALDREKFKVNLTVPVLDVRQKYRRQISPIIKDYRLQRFTGHSVRSSNNDTLSVLLDTSRVSTFDDLPTELTQFGVDATHFRWQNHEFTYDNWKANEIFAAVLPDTSQSFRAYSRIGHLLHVNLRDHLMPFKHLIGQVLLDKMNGIRTVVNKPQPIDNTFRTFDYELLAGDEDFVVTTAENGITYEFDFSKVFWNPRLSTEHERITKMIEAGDVLYDVFAGVGPFAVPCAKRRVTVLANDLNAEAARYLQHNAQLNKVSEHLRVFNKDGAQFLREDVKEDLIKRWSVGDASSDVNIHVTMNLPAIAVEFLNVFHGLMRGQDCRPTQYPIVHVYCFVKGSGQDGASVAQSLVEHHLGHELHSNLIEVCSVRTVATDKQMYRISFKLTQAILFAEK